MAWRVLIAEGDEPHRAALEAELSKACYDVSSVADPDALAASLDTGAPDVLMIGTEFLSDDILIDLRRSRDGQDTSIVGLLDTTQNRDCALMSGLDEAMPRPVGGTFLQARLRSLIRTTREVRELRRNQITAGTYGFAEPSLPWRPAPVAALVSLDGARLAAWATALGSIATRALSPDNILTINQNSGPEPDAIVLEISNTPAAANGLTLLAELRNRQATRRIPILAVLDGPAGGTAAMALDLGADDVLPAPASADELRLRVDRLLTRKEEVDALRAPVEESLRLAATDPLTGLFNRRYAVNAMRAMTQGAETNTTPEPVAVMVADLDHFKQVNDRFGHAAGDAVLAEVATRLRASLRLEDLLARFGGEEFLIVMRGLSADQARRAGERLCASIRGLTAPLGMCGTNQPVTISVGVATGHITASPENLDTLFAKADAALYSAKSAGRDRVCLVRSDAPGAVDCSGQNAA